MATAVMGLVIEAIQKMSSVFIFRPVARSLCRPPTVQNAVLVGDQHDRAGDPALVDKGLHLGRDVGEAIGAPAPRRPSRDHDRHQRKNLENLHGARPRIYLFKL